MSAVGGSYNSAIGYNALTADTLASFNTAVGSQSLSSDITGNNNTAIGSGALLYATSGNNTALGFNAGLNVAAGGYNVMIANQGTSSDDHIIRIGDVQTKTFIAGISGVNVTGVPVLVSSTGQLGIASSSRRFKEEIQDMADASNGLLRLRPVTYRYKQPYPDGSKPLDYGLIAEEVAEVYPDLVARTSDGQIQTVMYQKLTPMLLNEVQKLNNELAREREESQALKARMAQLEAAMRQFLATAGNPGN